MIWMLECLMLSQRFLSLSSFFEFLFLHCGLVECLFLPSAPNSWFESWFHSRHCWFPVDFYLFHIMQPSLLPGSFFMLLKYLVSSWSILITSVLNCAYDRLAMSLLLSCIFSGALICSFIWAIFFFCLGVPEPRKVKCLRQVLLKGLMHQLSQNVQVKMLEELVPV